MVLLAQNGAIRRVNKTSIVQESLYLNSFSLDNIGAILATADWLDRNPLERSASGPFLTLHTILIATIKAYEIQGCLQLLNAFNAVGLDHVILVKVASTAVVSWLLGLTESQALHAISQAWMDGHPLRVYRHAPNAGPRKGWAGGDACMRAVHLALLTRAGQPGAPTVLSVKRWGFNDSLFRGNQVVLARTLGSWVMENIFFKIVPAEGHALSAIEAMLILRSQLIEERRSLEEDILKIKVRTHAGACLIINKSGELHNAADRDHCIQYMLAVVLLKGELLEYADYEDDCQWATDPRIKALRAKIELTEDPQFTTDYHDPEKRSMSSGLTLELIDGTQLGETIVEYPLGNLKTKGTIEGLRAKLYRNLDLVFERSLSERIETAVQCEDDMPVKDFMDLLWKGSIL